MLKHRIVTAAVSGALLVAALFFLESTYISWLFGALMLVAAWEWAGLSGVSSAPARALYAVVLVSLGIAVLLIPASHQPVLLAALAWWVYALSELYRYHARQTTRHRWSMVRLVQGIFVLVPTWLALVSLHVQDDSRPLVIMSLFLTVWAADSGAYFAGKRFGRRKLAAHISPGKTVEGVVGGMLAATVVATGMGLGLWQDPGKLSAWALLVVVTVAFSVLGDLMESVVKREVGVKDSGVLFPGHGGILDRIDSLTAAAPVFLLGWQWIAQA
jgi:phosphatidate cytidylyltransferase